MITIIFLFSFFVFARAAIPACNGPVVFNPPQDTTQKTWYPSNFNGSQAPAFPDDYKCEYQINVPQGWFVTIQLTVVTTTLNASAPVNVVDQLARIEQVTQSTEELFFFVSNGGKIQLDTAKSGVQFGFNLKWEQYVNINPVLLNVTVGDLRPNLLNYFDNRSTVITAETRVSLTVMPQFDISLRQFFRAVVFFDGASTSATCLGTGLQVIDSKTQLVSTGKTLTVMNLVYALDGYDGTVEIQLQDYENTKDIKKYVPLMFDPKGDIDDFLTLSFDAADEPIALQSCCDPDGADVLTSIGGTGTLDIYLGGVTKSKTNLIASYTGGNTGSTLPQVIMGSSITYVMSGGPLSLNVSRDVSIFQYTDYERKSLMISPDYGNPSQYQDVEFEIFAPLMNRTYSNPDTVFRYSIQSVDLVPGVTFEIRCVGDVNTTVLSYNTSNLPTLNTAMSMQGSQLQIAYDSNDQINLGLHMTFEVLKSGSSCFSVLMMLVFLSIFYVR